MDSCILGANLLVFFQYFPAASMLLIALVICMNRELTEIISLPKGQYISLLITWAFLILEIGHAVAVILSLDVWFLAILHALQDVIRGECQPGEGLICHLFLETARHLATLIAACILVVALALEEDIARRVVPETRQALEALQDRWNSEGSPTSTTIEPILRMEPRSSSLNSLNRIPAAPSHYMIRLPSKAKRGFSNGNMKRYTRTSLTPKGIIINGNPLKASSIRNEQPKPSDIKLTQTSVTSMARKHDNDAPVRKFSMIEPISSNEQPAHTGAKVNQATKATPAQRKKPTKVTLSKRPPNLINPCPNNEQPAPPKGKEKPTPNKSMAKRKSALKSPPTMGIGQENGTSARQKIGNAKKQ